MSASAVDFAPPAPTSRPDFLRAPLVDGEAFRAVAGLFTSGVAVITSRDDGVDFGATVSAVSSVSLAPPSLLVCLNTRMGTQAAAHRSGAFAVNILDDTQGEIARRFATPSSDKFHGVRVKYGALGLPLIEGSLAQIECRVREDLLGGTHRIFIGEVCTAASRNGRPLSYFRGTFGRFVKFDEDLVYQRIRTRVLGEYHAHDAAIDVAALSSDLCVDDSLIFTALNRLQADGLIEFVAGDRWTIRPLDAEKVKAGIQMRAALEMGAATTAMLDPADLGLDSCRRDLDALRALIDAPGALEGASYVERDQRLHEGIVGLAKNASLSATYKTHTMSEAIRWIVGSDRELGLALIACSAAMIGALQNRDTLAFASAARNHAGLLAQSVDRSVRDQACRI